jgi:cytochrome c553
MTPLASGLRTVALDPATTRRVRVRTGIAPFISRAGALVAMVALVSLAPRDAGAQATTADEVLDDAKTCAPCHGPDGNSRLPNVPSLAGQPAFFMLNQLILMREGVRRVEVMAAVVRPLSDERIDALAKYFAALPPKASGDAVDPALSARGAPLAAQLRCASCHGRDLAGQDQMPRLAKQRIDYLISSMQALRDGTRTGADTLMTAAIRGVSDADLAALAHYISQ